MQEFAPGLFVADGPVVPFYGFPYPTRMAVIRLSDGGLFIWSPVALSQELRGAVDAFGPVHYVISPNKLHHLFLAEWKSAYPQARFYAPSGLRRKRRDLSFDAELGDMPEAGWVADIDQVLMHGSFVLTEAVFFHRSSGTALFADLIENLCRKAGSAAGAGCLPGWTGSPLQTPGRRANGGPVLCVAAPLAPRLTVFWNGRSVGY